MNLLILLPIILSIVCSFIVFAFSNEKRKIKNIVIISLIALVFASCLLNCFVGDLTLTIINITPSVAVTFKNDNLSKFFSVAISFVFLLVTIYTTEYIKHEKDENRFYIFFFLTLAMLIALTYSHNLMTMYVCFEFITLLSMPLVLHSLTTESVRAAKKYLYYSIGGAFLALFGMFYLCNYGGNLDFSTYGGHEIFKEGNFTENKTLFHIAVLTLIVGFSAKAGMFPLHGWLPTAHPVAPSPASAVLSGVITKAGVICVIRVVYFVVGPDFIRDTFVQYTWLGLASFTVFMGSLLAMFEKGFKKRLAFSSVSQVSYVLVGLAFLNDATFIGALIHVAAHMLIKVCLFLFAGEVIYKHGYHRVEELRGIGQKMPYSTWAFTFASLGLIGIPLTLGFVSKWNLATGAVNSGVSIFNFLVPAVLLASAILTAGYLLPITLNGFFVKDEKYERNECSKKMYIPMLILAGLVVILGVYSQPLVDLITTIVGK